MPRARHKTFIQGFDEVIGGGLPAGYAILVSGAPGTMKSSLCFSMMYYNALHNGTKSAYFTLEQSKDTLIEQMQSLGLNDEAAYRNVLVLDMGAIRKNLSFSQTKGTWLDLFKMYASNLMKSEKISILAVDSLDVLETLARFQDRRTDLYYLFEWLRGLGATSLLISERPLDLSPSGVFTEEAFLADGILQVGMYPTSDVFVQRRIRCVKMRATKHEPGYLALVWDEGRFEVTRAVSGLG